MTESENESVLVKLSFNLTHGGGAAITVTGKGGGNIKPLFDNVGGDRVSFGWRSLSSIPGGNVKASGERGMEYVLDIDRSSKKVK